MGSVGFEHWTSYFGAEDGNSASLMLDYIDAMFITYTPSHFFDDFSHRSGRKIGLEMD